MEHFRVFFLTQLGRDRVWERNFEILGENMKTNSIDSLSLRQQEKEQKQKKTIVSPLFDPKIANGIP